MRKRGRLSKGWGKRVKIHDDLRSALVHEIVEQINESSVVVTSRLNLVPDLATYRVAMFVSEYPTLIRRGYIINPDVAPGDILTEFGVAYVKNGDWNEVTPVNPTYVVRGIGQNAGALTAHSAIEFKDLVEGTHATALPNAWGGPFILPALNVLYLELFNNENITPTSLECSIEWANMDRLDLQPSDLSRNTTLSPRTFGRSTRRPE